MESLMLCVISIGVAVIALILVVKLKKDMSQYKTSIGDAQERQARMNAVIERMNKGNHHI
jgi:multisubunit Na+/H+ antiporter MnhC subunit